MYTHIQYEMSNLSVLGFIIEYIHICDLNNN